MIQSFKEYFYSVYLESSEDWIMYAKNKGYNIPAYHGTNQNFNKFVKGFGISGSMFGIDKVKRNGFFFAENESDAKTFGQNIIPVLLKGKLANLHDSDVVDELTDEGLNYKWLYDGDIWEKFDGVDGEYLISLLKKIGYDGVVFTEPSSGNHSSFTAYMVFDENQIKIFSPITYDDNNQLIPLSERFDSSSDDIRY